MADTSPKIVLLDIETSPNLGYIWGKYQQDVIAFEREWYILCFAIKTLGKNDLTSVALPDFRKAYKANPEDDSYLLGALWGVLDDADIVIAHNGDEFDLKKINARFAINGFKPPSPYKTIDTLKEARRHFGFTSNKLGDLAIALKLREKKLETTFDLWKGCMSGNPKSWAIMERYNRRDVELLEEVYNRLKPWDTLHPALGAFNAGGLGCSRCGNKELQSRGKYVSRTLTYHRYYCGNCGGWMRSTTRIKSPRPLVAI